jgi:four helix bundle protein
MSNGQLSADGRARGDELSKRLIAFVVRVYKLCAALPKQPISRHVALQMFRAASSAGANYEEARGAESLDDFIHKMRVVHKELKEARFWLNFMHEAEVMRPQRLGQLLK